MEQKEVKINGLKINNQFGILEVCELVFDEKINMYVTKGGAGQGKTSFTTALQLCTQGGKTMIDKNKYGGDIDIEVPLTDGDLRIWIGCKTGKKGLQYVLYAKDANNKKIKNPVIDGIEATPARYLEALQTELTWKMDELTSENPSVQRKILLKLYQSGLKEIGIIFDKNHPDYQDSILGQIDEALRYRDEKDYLRKTKGGIADDLKAQGFDPDRPETCPNEINIIEIEQKIKASEKELTQKETDSEGTRKTELAELATKGQRLVNDCLIYNADLKSGYDKLKVKFYEYSQKKQAIATLLNGIAENYDGLVDLGAIKEDKGGATFAKTCLFEYPKEVKEPKKPEYIILNEKNQALDTNIEKLDKKGKDILNEISKLRENYGKKLNEPKTFDPTELKAKIEKLELSKVAAIENNKIVDAVNSFHEWREANEDVVHLKNKYVKLLAKVDTGVEGLKITPIEDDIFLMYDGSYDPVYFGNKNRELRKLSSYSGTQRPVICLLIQNYLLSKKPKAMRYMHIDNIPIDMKTRGLLEQMSIELNLHIFLNITGDFKKENLADGEVLVEGGEVFFK